jgi:DNA-binding winged helix-turn-helix (wHTH) protein/tetratricopeptide (TPR) repeat protein
MDEAPIYEFGPWRLDAAQRLLFREGERVQVPPKILETLLVLVENHGRIVEKEFLISRLWPDSFVEDGSLLRNVSTLRSLLADGQDGGPFIETIPKRGYRFVAPVSLVGDDAPAARSAPHEPGAPAIHPRRWPWVRVAAAAAALAAMIVAVTLLWRWNRPPALDFAERDWLVVSDFENHTGDARFDRGLQAAFTIALEQSRHVNLVPRSRITNVLRRMGKPPDQRVDEGIAQEICAREGARAMVAASIVRTGERYGLVVKLIDPRTGLAVRSYSRRIGTEDGVLDSLDDIARELRRDLGESLAELSLASRPLPQVTTASLEALQQFAEGRELWARGKYEDSLAAYEAAVRLDPDFAMAHAALGSGLSGPFIQGSRSRTEFEKALALSARTTERERLLIEFRSHAALMHYEEATRLAETYLRIYPDDVEARRDLAYLLLVSRRCEGAVAHYEQILRISKLDAHANVNLGTCFYILGKHADSIAAYERAFAIEPDWISETLYNRQFGYPLIYLDQAARAREVYALNLGAPEADEKANALRSLAFVDLFEGKYQTARSRLREAIPLFGRHSLNHARTCLFLSQLEHSLGNERSALAELAQVEALLTEPRNGVEYNFYCRMGAELARMGELGKAQIIAKTCRVELDSESDFGRADLYRLEGEIELARGNAAKAAELLALADSDFTGPLTVDSLARAYRRLGRNDDAVALFEKLIATPDVLGWEAQLPWTEAHVSLAELYVERGDTEKARKLLDTFLARWKDADPRLPLLLRARSLTTLAQ